MAIVVHLVSVVTICTSLCAGTINLGHQPYRSPYSDAVGDSWGSYVRQIIPFRSLWSSEAEDYNGYGAIPTKFNLEDLANSIKINSPNLIPVVGTEMDNKDEIRGNHDVVSINLPSSKKPNADNTVEETTTKFVPLGNFRPEDEIIATPQLPVEKINQFGGTVMYQIIPPGKPWPARPEDYESFSQTSQKPSLQDRFKETTTIPSTSGLGSFRPEDEIIAVPQLPVPNRPPFLGPTGGNFIPQIIPPGKPWPARPEDYEGFTTNTQKTNVEDKIKETTTLLSTAMQGNGVAPVPNRTPILGPTGGKPWPAKPENYEGFNTTSQKSNMEDGIKETSTILSTAGQGSFKPEDEVIIIPQLQVPNRPPFLGPTGGNFIPQIIPPGKPWPAGPEDHSTSQKPIVEDRLTDFMVPGDYGPENHKVDDAISQKPSVEGTTTFSTQNSGNNRPNLLNLNGGDKLLPSKVSNQTRFRAKMPLLSVSLGLDDIKHAIDFTNKIDGSSITNTDGDVNEFILSQQLNPMYNNSGTAVEPVVSVLFDLAALKRAVTNSTNENVTKGAGSVTNISSYDIQNEDTINASTEDTSIRLNISSIPTEDDPFLSIFLNIEALKNAMADFSVDNNTETGSRYVRIVPKLNDKTTRHPSFPHLVDDTLRRNVSTLLTMEADEVLA